jgi:predicted lactoylglutathione lyase
MAAQIFVNLPVEDLQKSIDFYKKLDFTLNPQFTDSTAACMVLSEAIFVMLLTKPKFKSFTPKEIADARKVTEVMLCLSCESRERLMELTHRAVNGGGSKFMEPKDYGFMLQQSFQDPDGHVWELVHMDPAAMNKS